MIIAILGALSAHAATLAIIAFTVDHLLSQAVTSLLSY